jgi:hypothetical protein
VRNAVAISALLAASLFAALDGATARTRNHLFDAPQDHVDRSVMVCGYVVYGNSILERQDGVLNRRGGLVILDDNPLPPNFDGHVCVEGRIGELCGEHQSICSEGLFDFGISINRVLSAVPRPARGG